ncbi:MAG TPA: TraI domain-containing protein [Candidatus Gastranaerophilales bacterium]|nr:TraI domain-containing protein [Candidatus Gastranaerophilales bacterium]
MLRQNSEYKIGSYQQIETKNGDLMVKIQLVDTQTDEKHNCVIWEDCLQKIPKKALRVGNIISIIDSDYNDKFNNDKIKQIKLVKEVKIGLSEPERDEAFSKILKIVDSFQNENLKKEITALMLENAEFFKTSPAAKNHHHNYVGGLMTHVLECVDFAKSLFSVIPASINCELILAGAIMHDFGKIFEYMVDMETGVIDIDEEWQKIWISHIYWGFSWANQRGFSELAHIIASHHGIKDYGALVEPATKEADLLYGLDYMSSRVGKLCAEELEKSGV